VTNVRSIDSLRTFAYLRAKPHSFATILVSSRHSTGTPPKLIALAPTKLKRVDQIFPLTAREKAVREIRRRWRWGRNSLVY
jgi:hypothetical protein